MTSAVHLQRGARPSGGNWQYLAMGQPHMIGSAALELCWAIMRPSAASNLKKAWPILWHQQYIFREGLGQLEAISSTSSEQLWAINRSLVVSGCWPIPCRHKTVLKWFWAIRRPSAASNLKGAWPIPCHRQYVIWANPMLPAALLWNYSGLSEGYRRHLVRPTWHHQ